MFKFLSQETPDASSISKSATSLTMTSSDGCSSILLKHFDAHQRQNAEKRSSSSSASSSFERELSRLEAIRRDLGVLSTPPGDSHHHKKKQPAKSSQSTKELNQKEIFDTLIHILDWIVPAEITNDSKLYIHSLLRLHAVLSTALLEESVNIEALIQRVCLFSNVFSEKVRANACQWTGYLTGAIGLYALHLPAAERDTLLDSTSQLLVPRFTDKSVAVRLAAVQAGPNFFLQQDTIDPDIQQALQWSLQHDPSVAVRACAATCIPLNLQTIDAVLARIHDVKAKVRVAALQRFMSIPSLQELDPEQCAAIVKSGWTDRCLETKKAVSTLISINWMNSAKLDPLALLRHVNVLQHESACDIIVAALFETSDDVLAMHYSPAQIQLYRHRVESANIDFNEAELSIELVFFARALGEHAKKSGSLTNSEKETIVSRIVPDIPVLCDALERHTLNLLRVMNDESASEDDRLKLAFTCSQIIKLSSVVEFEEGSRRQLLSLLKRMIGSVVIPDDLVEDSLNTLIGTERKESDSLQTVLEICEAISDDLQNNADELATNYQLRILSILSITLEHLSPSVPNVVRACSKYTTPAMTHLNPLVREAAVASFGRLGLFSNGHTILNEWKPLLLEVASNKQEKLEARAQALMALVDWSLLFPNVLDPISVGEDGSAATSLTVILSDWTKLEENLSTTCIAAEMQCKLVFSERVLDPVTIARLLLLYFDDRLEQAQEDDDQADPSEIGSAFRLQQLLSLLFPALCVKSSSARDAFCQSIAAVLDALCNKPKRPKSQQIVKILEYMIDCAKASELMAGADDEPLDQEDEADSSSTIEGSGVVVQIAIAIATFMLEQGEDLPATVTRALCKVLGKDKIVHGDVKQLLKLKQLCDELEMIVTDKSALASLLSLQESLADISIQENEDDSRDQHEGDDDDDDQSMGQTEGDDEDVCKSIKEKSETETTNDKENNNQGVQSIENSKVRPSKRSSRSRFHETLDN